MKNGVPYDVAFALEPADRLAHCVVLLQFEGHEWDWDRMAVREKK